MPQTLSTPSAAPAGETFARRTLRALRVEIPEVWVRFLLALVGLVLAFGAALFSTVSRESGNLPATLVLASAALLLAVIVGLTTVPYLARRVVAARLRDAIAYDVTRVGLVYCLLVVLIGVAALNTGNNLLYIVTAAMLAAILASGIASAAVLSELQLDVRMPEHLFAGRSAMGRAMVRNPRKWLPSLSIGVELAPRKKSRKRWKWLPATFGIPLWYPPEKQWLKFRDLKLRRVGEPDTKKILDGSVYFPYVPPRSEVSADLQFRLDRRGCYFQQGFGLGTLFPFGFLSKTRLVPLTREIIVYPKVEPTDELLEILPMITGEWESFERGRGHDLYRIREYLPDDSARHVDWKATAKSGSLKVREFSREDERKLRIVFDQPAREMVSEKNYESAVAMAASLSWHFSRENAEVSFMAQGYEGSPDVYPFLRYLALAEPSAGRSLLEEIRPSEDYNIILTARQKGSIPTALWACSYFIFMDK
ncbi:MAG TPA: DUF58 domain-containing protein [Terriglobales bacterium]